MPNPEQSGQMEVYAELTDKPEEEVQFSEEEKKIIEQKRQILSSLAYFIGKDFQIPVELNTPGAGWHWDFQANIIRIDPKDLLEKPMDYLRFVISHEGGHRRISRTDFIPLETWSQPGFSFMMNAIEDPRDNNFVAESYPRFKEQMNLAYAQDLDLEQKSKEKAQTKLGYQPRFMQAGFEYIKQWFRESQGQDLQITEDLPDEVKAVVSKTLASAQDSWWRYPTKTEADQSEELIRRYAERSYRINLEQVWPEFKKLVEKDMEDQKTQEMLKDMEQAKGEGQGLPQDLKNKLTPEEQQALEEAIEKALEEAKAQAAEEIQEGQEPKEGEGKGGQPIDMDSLSEELKQKIKEYIDSLPEDKKQELKDKAQASIKDFGKELGEELEGKLTEDPAEKVAREAEAPKDESNQTDEKPEEQNQPTKPLPQDLEDYRKRIAETLKKDANTYEKNRREVINVINNLENDLREIFVSRRMHAWRGGFKSGKRIDIKRRIQEKAKEISVMESQAWEKRELPNEKDYAICLLVDLSGSMQGTKIDETFKAVIVLAEVLNRLSISTEILGFNDKLYEYQNFGENISNRVRENMGGMLLEVDSDAAAYNDDGWALNQASERLAKQKAKEKFLIVLSDGIPVESPGHSSSSYDLSSIVTQIVSQTDQKLIGLGIGPGTKHVANYYPNSLADVNLEEMAEKLADLIREAIANYDKF